MTPEAGSVPPEALKEPHLGLPAPEPREDTVLVSSAPRSRGFVPAATGNRSHLPAPHLKTKSEGTKPALPLRGHPVSSGASPPPAAVPCGDTVSSPSFSSLGGLGRLHRRLPKEIKCGHMCSSKFSHSRVEKMNRKRVKFILIMHAVSLLHPKQYFHR